MIFLIKYNRKEGIVLETKSYNDSDRQTAENARLEMELSLIHNGIDQEVVLLDANSENDLRQTHRRYFENLQEIAST